MALSVVKRRAAKRAAPIRSKHAASKNAPGEEMTPGPVLDLDDPEIGIAFDLTSDIGVGGGLGTGAAPVARSHSEPPRRAGLRSG